MKLGFLHNFHYYRRHRKVQKAVQSNKVLVKMVIKTISIEKLKKLYAIVLFLTWNLWSCIIYVTVMYDNNMDVYKGMFIVLNI